jgi:predicted porin
VKRKLSAVAATIYCTGAFAQSGLSVYGILDVSINAISLDSTSAAPSGKLNAVSSDASRLGFRGTEDLGGGASAYFKLEHGLQVDTGANTSATQFWNRETFVGLSSKRFGAVQLGSQFTPAVFSSARIDPFGRFGLGAITTLFQGGSRGWTVTANNSIQYITPALGGVTAKVMHALSEGAATGARNAAALEYANGPLYLAINHDDQRVTGASVTLPGAAVASKTSSIGGMYDFKLVKLHGFYQVNRIRGLPTVDGYMLGASVPIGAGEIRMSYAHRSEDRAGASLAAIGYFHSLSKRTLLYTQLGALKNNGASAFGLGPARTEAASTGQLLAGRDAKGVQLGIRHFF